MRILENNIIEFEFLLAVSTGRVGEVSSVSAKQPDPFCSANAPGEPAEFSSFEEINQVGQDIAKNLNKIFA